MYSGLGLLSLMFNMLMCVNDLQGWTARNVVNWSVQALNSPPTHEDADEQDEQDGFTKVTL